MNVALYLYYIFNGVNIYEKQFYQRYKFIIASYCVKYMTKLNFKFI